jgi:polar amino acid transport system substrate-binding protein
MTRIRILLAVLLIIAPAFGLAACGGDDGGDAGSTAADCSRAALPLVTSGKLTVGTAYPAIPPYFEGGDPFNGSGFEGAIAYAIADALGFTPSAVVWAVVPRNESFAPGPKNFDFDINQIAVTELRAKQVDFSLPYYTTPQAVVVGKGSRYARATTFSALSDARFGVPAGTTSLDAVTDVISPDQRPHVYNDSHDTVRALKSGQVDAIVLDLPTAFALTATEIKSGTIVGQFQAPGGDDWGVVLAKGSGLTPCVDAAIGRLRDSGELQRITNQWIGAEAVPELTSASPPR